MPCRRINAAEVAEKFNDEIREAVRKAPSPIRLVGLLSNPTPASKTYARWTGNSCNKLGITFELQSPSSFDLEATLRSLNEDENVHGIMIYYPVFGGSQDAYIQGSISMEKDVEGLSSENLRMLYHNERVWDEGRKKAVLPCTPLAIVKILTHIGIYNQVLQYGNCLHGRVITVINRSEIVGRPLAAMLANDGATVYSVDINNILTYSRGPSISEPHHKVASCDKNLEQALQCSDVVISGVPSKEYKVKTEWLKEGCMCVCFSSWQNFEDDVEKKASVFVPSVGKVTVAMLQRNLVRLYEQRRGADARDENP